MHLVPVLVGPLYIVSSAILHSQSYRPGCWGAISTPYWRDSFILSGQCHQHWCWGAMITPY